LPLYKHNKQYKQKITSFKEYFDALTYHVTMPYSTNEEEAALDTTNLFEEDFVMTV
jgi:hypothetical protein